MPVFLDQLDDGHWIHWGIGFEGDRDDGGCCLHFQHPIGLAQHPQPVHLNQRFGLWWQFSEAVHQFFKQGIHLHAGIGGREFFVKRQAQMHIAAVIIGQQRRSMQVDFCHGPHGTEQIGLLAFLELLDGFGQHFVVKLKANFHDVAALVFTQHLARAANFKIVHGQVKAATEFFHLLNGFQPLVRLLGQPVQIGDHQVGIGLVVTTAHTAAQLVQLRQAELVGATDEYGVGGGHVNAGLDDGGAQQNIETLCHKVAHHALQLTLWHLAVGNGYARLGQDFFELLAAVLNGFDLVVQEIDLSAALQFTQHGFANHTAVFAAHKSLDGQPPLRRGGDHGKIPQPFQRHAQCARNGGGGECQHIHIGTQLLHLLLVAHAKAVLFIDDKQAQVLELRLFRQQFVRTNHDVDRAILNAFERSSNFFAGTEAAHLGHFHRPFGEAVFQRLVVLLGQQCSGSQKRHLFAASHSHKRGAQRHLGLAKAHVATDKAIHRAR